MSRRDRERGDDGGRHRAAGRPDAGARGAPGRSRWLLVAVVVVAAGLLAWLALRPRLAPRGPDTAGNTGPAAAMTPPTAYATALRLSQAGRHEESLLYYRRALTGAPQNPWVVHYNYGGALYNVGLEVRDCHGVAVPTVRSSIERVALMREALGELDVAERLATTARDRAMVMRARGERFQIWGFPWDAFVQLRQAQWTDPERKELGGAADGYLLVLEHPERPWTRGADADRPAP